jgi:hypothetical protein
MGQSSRPLLNIPGRGERFRDWVLVSPTKERQNESYLEAAVGTERCNAIAWQRRVGERLGRLTLSKHWRVGIARSLKADRTLAHALIEVTTAVGKDYRRSKRGRGSKLVD